MKIKFENPKDCAPQAILKKDLGHFSIWLVLLLTFLLSVHFPAEAQKKSSQPIITTGTVKDSLGSPLAAVTISDMSNKTKTLTDDKGNFSLSIIPGDLLRITRVGYEPQQITARSVHPMQVVLKVKRTTLSDVVVVGYGTVKKKDLTGAVSTVKERAFTDRTLFSVADAIKGKAAGVQITQNDGTPGSESTIRIRGASSVSASSAPLYVIDGVLQDDANSIDPADIKSVEILKDASSTAIYGSRGANGVIIITTKTGSAGKTLLSFYSNIGLQQPTHLYSLMDAREYARAQFLASAYTYSPASATNSEVPATTLSDYTYYRDSPLNTEGGFWGVKNDATYNDWEKYDEPDSANTDWQKTMYQNGLIQDYHINVSGGNAHTKYSFMGGYYNQDGLIVYSGYQRYNGRLNLSQKLSKKVTLFSNISSTHTGTNGYISNSDNGGITSNPIITSVLVQPPTNPLTYTDLEDNGNVEGYITTNPYSLAKSVTNEKLLSQAVIRLGVDWTINKNFTFRSTGSYVNNDKNTDSYYPKTVASGAKYDGRAIVARQGVVDLMNENLLYYKGRVGQHTFNALAGATFEQNKSNLLITENRDFTVENLGSGGLENGTSPIVPTYNLTKWTMASFLGRLEYGFRDKYLATITMRADGSSRFSKTDKWGYFPSAAIAWKVSNEPFFKDLSSINNLKFRATLGQSGNTAIPSYLTLSTIGTYFSPMDGYTPDYGVVVERPENNSLKWETTTQLDAGMDISLFNNALNITADWYSKRTKDLLIQKVTPAYSGYTSTWTNLGSIENQGFEMNLEVSPILTRSFHWDMNANIGFNRAKAVDVGGELDLDPGVVVSVGTSVIIRNGDPLGEWYGYQTDGIFQSEADIIASGLTVINGQPQSSLRPGSRKFVDQNGDGVIDAQDRVVLGRGQPDFTGGLTNSFSYKGFNLNVVVQYSYGNKIYNANRVPPEASLNNDNLRAVYADAWRPSLYDITTGTLVEQGNPNNKYRMPGNPAQLIMMSDFIEDGSYIRISDITLSYGFKVKKIKDIGMSNLLVFVSGKNLFLWTKYTGYDPEVNTRQGGFGDLMPSLDYASYPRSKIYSLGIKAQF